MYTDDDANRPPEDDAGLTAAERELEEDKELARGDPEQLEMIPAGETGEMAARTPTSLN